MFRIRQPASATMEHLGCHLVGALPAAPDLVAVLDYNILHYLWSLIGDNPDGEFANDLKPHNLTLKKLNQDSTFFFTFLGITVLAPGSAKAP